MPGNKTETTHSSDAHIYLFINNLIASNIFYLNKYGSYEIVMTGTNPPAAVLLVPMVNSTLSDYKISYDHMSFPHAFLPESQGQYIEIPVCLRQLADF